MIQTIIIITIINPILYIKDENETEESSEEESEEDDEDEESSDEETDSEEAKVQKDLLSSFISKGLPKCAGILLERQ